MSEIIKKEDGTEVEVFSAEEIEAQKEEAKQEAIEQYKLDNPDKTEELTALQAELEKLKSKDVSISELRKQKNQAESKIEEIVKGTDEKITKVKQEIMEGVMQDHYNDTIKALVGDDEELRKKVEHEFKKTLSGVNPTTKDELAGKLRNAYLLATKPAEVDALNSSVISSGGVGRLNIKSEKKFSQEEKQMAKVLAEAGGIKLEESDFK